MGLFEGIVVGILMLLAAIVAVAVFLRRPTGPAAPRPVAELRDDFRRHREMLEAKFFEAAAGRGIPRGLTWIRCDFADEVTFARDKNNGERCALVALTIGFEAVVGGDME